MSQFVQARQPIAEILSVDNSEPDEVDSSLDEAASNERDYVRRRLNEELNREPTEQEIDDWLRQQTEGY